MDPVAGKNTVGLGGNSLPGCNGNMGISWTIWPGRLVRGIKLLGNVGNIIFSHSCVFNLGLISAFFKKNWDRRDFGPQAGQIIDSCAYQLKGNPPISSSKNQIIKSIIKSIIIHHHSSSYLSDSIDYLSARLTPPGKTCTHLAFLGPGLGNQSWRCVSLTVLNSKTSSTTG